MKYMLMIHDDQTKYESASPEQMNELFGAYMAYSHQLRTDGIMLEGHALQPPMTATTVRIENAKRLTTDGPYAEAKEQLGGYFIVDVADVEAATAIAERICSFHTWNTVAIEVRPVMIFGNE
jgi:hypothetical protein